MVWLKQPVQSRALTACPNHSRAASLPPGSAWTQLRRIWQFNWKITTAAWALFFSVLLVYYLSLTWMPRILIGAGFEEYKAFVTTASMAAVGLLGVIVAALLVERVGRKWILAITGPLSALTLVIVAIVVDVPSAAVFWLLVFGFVVQVAIPVLYAYVSELYPHRASWLGLWLGFDVLAHRCGLRSLGVCLVLLAGVRLGAVVRDGWWPGAAVRSVDGVLRSGDKAASPRVTAPPLPPRTQLSRISARFGRSKRALMRPTWVPNRVVRAPASPWPLRSSRRWTCVAWRSSQGSILHGRSLLRGQCPERSVPDPNALHLRIQRQRAARDT